MPGPEKRLIIKSIQRLSLPSCCVNKSQRPCSGVKGHNEFFVGADHQLPSATNKGHFLNWLGDLVRAGGLSLVDMNIC